MANAKPPAGPPWPGKIVDLRYSGGRMLYVDIDAGGPAAPLSVVEAAVAKATEELSASECCAALTRQRGLLARCRADQPKAQRDVGAAREARKAAFRDGNDSAGADADLASALGRVEALTERISSLCEAIAQREREAGALWGKLALDLRRRLMRETDERFERAKKSLSAARRTPRPSRAGSPASPSATAASNGRTTTRRRGARVAAESSPTLWVPSWSCDVRCADRRLS